MKIIKHGKSLRFVCENCECEWQEVGKNCEYDGFSRAYWYQCPECGKITKGTKIEVKDIIPS